MDLFIITTEHAIKTSKAKNDICGCQIKCMPNKMLAKRMQDEEVCKLQLNGCGQQGIQIRANK